MEKKDLKKLLANFGIASLISMGGVTLPGAHAGSSWGAKPSAGGTEQIQKAPAGSGWGAKKGSAVSAEEQEQLKKQQQQIQEEAEEKAKEVLEKKDEPVKKPAGKSGWGGKK
jgi:radical SAM modification target selenobiotic family peptide